MKDTLQLKHSFENIKKLRGDISNIFETIHSKINVLKKVYIDMIQTHSKSEYMFGIDAFHFQNELLDIEYNNMKNAFKKIDNRMYCEYYQLYVLMRKYIEEEITNESLRSKVLINKRFPVYKVLDVDRIYRFSLVIDLHDYITNTIVELESYRIAKDSELENDTQQSKQGLNIGNLVNSYRYANALLSEKIKMFVRYLKVFHEHHRQYFTRLSIRAKLNIGIINEDIMIKQLNSNGMVDETVNYKQHMSDEDSILKYVGSADTNNVLKGELNKIISNISYDSETSPRSNESENSTISSQDSLCNDLGEQNSPTITDTRHKAENIVTASKLDISEPEPEQEPEPEPEQEPEPEPEPEPELEPEPEPELEPEPEPEQTV